MYGNFFVSITVKVLDRSHLVFELASHLIYLSTLHVQVVDLVPFYCCWVTTFSVFSMLIVEMLVSVSELLNHELLELNDVDDIKKCLDVVHDHDAELASDAAVTVFSCNEEDSFQKLATQSFTQILLHVNWFVVFNFVLWYVSSRHQGNFSLSKLSKRWMKERQNEFNQLKRLQSCQTNPFDICILLVHVG